MRLAAVLVSACVLAPACDDSPVDPPVVVVPDASSRYTYAQHIQPILRARCSPCHVDFGVGPFALDDYDDAVVWATLSTSAVEEGSMPPFPPAGGDDCAPLDDPRHMPQLERDMFIEWARGGRPLGDPALPAEFSVATRSDTLGVPTHRFPLGDEYVATVEVTEEFRCFRVDPALTEVGKRVRALAVDTPTWERIHYAQVHILPADRVAEAVALEGLDGRPGWPCYFNPGIAGLRPVGGFTPGLVSAPYPDGTTQELVPGEQFVVATYVHSYDYEPLDLSVIAWESPESSDRAPVVLHLSDDSFVIPAGAESVTATVEAEVVASSTDLRNRPDDAFPGVHQGRVWSVDVHMHHWGRSATIEVVRVDGRRDCLLHIPAWDEEWQGGYRLAEPAQVAAGDHIVATCEWSNRPEDQPLVLGVQIAPAELRWGLGEMQETCDVRLTLTP